MYTKGTKNYVTFFNSDKDSTEKVVYGRVSESFKKTGGRRTAAYAGRKAGV